MLLQGAVSAREFGATILEKIRTGDPLQAYHSLAPILNERTPFRLLDIIGESISTAPREKLGPFLEKIAAQKTEGGWVVIASALKPSLATELENVLQLSRQYIIAADIWYACDIFGERVLGNALVDHFDEGLDRLDAWRSDENRWVRRSLGVAGHYWAKRTKSDRVLNKQAQMLLAFFEPMLAEANTDAAKGVGWALKTMSRYRPTLIHDYLRAQSLNDRKIAPRIRGKALKFLPEPMKKESTNR